MALADGYYRLGFEDLDGTPHLSFDTQYLKPMGLDYLHLLWLGELGGAAEGRIFKCSEMLDSRSYSVNVYNVQFDETLEASWVDTTDLEAGLSEPGFAVPFGSSFGFSNTHEDFVYETTFRFRYPQTGADLILDFTPSDLPPTRVWHTYLYYQGNCDDAVGDVESCRPVLRTLSDRGPVERSLSVGWE
jgi:hypothetical protein